YLATALFASPVVEANGIGTVAVDRHWRLYVDPGVANHWTVQELGSTLVHHAGHLLRDHADRAHAFGVEQKATEAWVKAADAEKRATFPSGCSGGLRTC